MKTMKSRSALILIHIQNEIVSSEGLIGRLGIAEQISADNLISKLWSVQKMAREAHALIVHGIFSPRQHGCETTARFLTSAASAADAWQEWGTSVPAHLAGEDDLYHGSGTLGVFTPNLVQELRLRGVSSVVLAGVSTEFSVLASTYAAVDAGFRTTLITDCCTSHDRERHRVALDLMSRTCCCVRAEEVSFR